MTMSMASKNFNLVTISLNSKISVKKINHNTLNYCDYEFLFLIIYC